MKPSICLLGLLALSAPISAQPQAATPPQSAPNPYLKSVETDFGWQITPVVLPEDNAATMFRMKFWRFKIENPDAKIYGSFTLELRRYQQTPIKIKEGNFEIGGNVEFTLGLMPTGPTSLWKADAMKVSALILMAGGGNSINEEADVALCANPIKDINSDRIITGYAGTGTINADGSIILTRFLVGKTPNEGENQLVLVFKAAA